MADVKAAPRNGVVDAASIISSLSSTFLGSGKTTNRSSTTANLSANDAVLASVMGDINNPDIVRGIVDNIMVRASQTFAPSYAAEKSAGLYNSTTLNQMRDEYAARATGEASKAVLDYRTEAQKTATAAARTQAENTRDTVTYGSQKPAVPGMASSIISAGLLATSLATKIPGALEAIKGLVGGGLKGSSLAAGNANGDISLTARDVANTSDELLNKVRVKPNLLGGSSTAANDALVPEVPVDPLAQAADDASAAFPAAGSPGVEEFGGGVSDSTGGVLNFGGDVGGAGGDAAEAGSSIFDGLSLSPAGAIIGAILRDGAGTIDLLANDGPYVDNSALGGAVGSGGAAVATGTAVTDNGLAELGVGVAGGGPAVGVAEGISDGSVGDTVNALEGQVDGASVTDIIGSAGDFFDDVSIICTELVRQGRLNKRHYIASAKDFAGYWNYGKRGYYLWSRACVRHLRNYPDSRFSALLNKVFAKRAEQIAARLGVRGARWTLGGAVLDRGMYAACFALACTLGWTVKPQGVR
jgi:hypothetical protein